MEVLTLSGPTGYKGGSAQTSGPFVGYDDGKNCVLRYSFKTPSSGYITALKFATTLRHYSGSGSTTFTIRAKVTTSSSSYNNAGASTTDYDGSFTISGQSNQDKSCTLSGLWLKPNTTYYLWLFPGGTSAFLKYCYDNNGDDTSSLEYTAITATYALSISAGTGSSITVSRTSSPSGSTGTLSDGATIYAGDVLKISFEASTGYNISTHTVNGSAFTSGDTHTVKAAVAVVSTAALKTFKLTISAGTGSTITVKKGSTTLTNGATITYGDELTITFGAGTGYNLDTHTVNGSEFTSGGTHTVKAAVAVVSTAALKTFKLSISAGTGSTITVKKGSTTLTNGAPITYGDELTITIKANTGYNLDTHTVNGSKFTSGGTYTVKATVTVASTATVKSFALSISAGTGSTIIVTRTESPLQGAGTGQLTDGATIYYNDVLSVTFDGTALYEVLTGTLNGADFTSGGTHTVTGAVVVVTTTRILGYVYLTVGGVVKKFRIIIHHNGSWRKYRPRILHSDEDISAFGVGDTIIVTTSLSVTTEGSTIIIGGA